MDSHRLTLYSVPHHLNAYSIADCHHHLADYCVSHRYTLYWVPHHRRADRHTAATSLAATTYASSSQSVSIAAAAFP